MSTLGKSQEGEEEELTVPYALVNDKRKGNMGLLNLCVIFKSYLLLCHFNAILKFKYSSSTIFVS